MKAYISAALEAVEWRLMSGSIAYLLTAMAIIVLLGFVIGVTASNASAGSRSGTKKLSVTAPATTAEPAPTVLDEVLNVVSRMFVQTERVTSKRL
jgi:hypothetical protein